MRDVTGPMLLGILAVSLVVLSLSLSNLSNAARVRELSARIAVIETQVVELRKHVSK